MTFLDGALQSEAVQHQVELSGGDEAILILIVEVESVFELGRAAVGGVGVAEGGELGEVDETVVVSVEVVHDPLELRRGDAGSEGTEDVVQLVDGDLAVTVGVEAAENSLEFFDVHVLEVHRGLGVTVRV